MKAKIFLRVELPNLRLPKLEPIYPPTTDTTVWSNCTGDSKVGLWKVKGSNHVPTFFGQSVIEKALEFVR